MRAFRSALHSPHADELRFPFAAASDIFDAHHMRAAREDLASLRPAIDPAPVCGGGQLGDRVAIVDAARTLGCEHNVSFGDAVDGGVVFHDDERMHHVCVERKEYCVERSKYIPMSPYQATSLARKVRDRRK